MPLKESGEMYLESIYVLCTSRSNVRSIDVAEYMNYSKPSVSRAIGLLKQQEYIEVDSDGYISLTEEGKNAAKKIFERHTVLTGILQKIGVDSETASEDACRIEHIISDRTFEAIKEVYDKLKK
ncbi:MAG: metal-dependent transcriptional regulator [Ruminococcaceae bacterium]|nr:metal-dependent transcriptional regulator [Oscillospiraceae bacterium]